MIPICFGQRLWIAVSVVTLHPWNRFSTCDISQRRDLCLIILFNKSVTAPDGKKRRLLTQVFDYSIWNRNENLDLITIIQLGTSYTRLFSLKIGFTVLWKSETDLLYKLIYFWIGTYIKHPDNEQTNASRTLIINYKPIVTGIA